MITAEKIRNLLEEEVKGHNLFLVDVVTSPGNRIAVYIDSMKGVTVEECISVSRYLESRLDRTVEDFELEVSSPGLDRPLKLPVQYEKNRGRILDVVLTDGIKLTGKLTGISADLISLETEVIIKEGKGKKRTELMVRSINQHDIKTAKVVISLKK
jgi:ribosome maturation factor RimP